MYSGASRRWDSPRTRARFRKRSIPFSKRPDAAAATISDGVASATRLQFPGAERPGRPRSKRSANRWSCWWIRRIPQNSLLLRKPTARIPHAGGQRIQPGSPEEAALRAWIDRLAQLKGDELAKALRYREEEASGAGAMRPRIVLRRLTHSQYNNTVRDLLGDRSLPANQFPPEDFVNGFKNQYAAQNLSPLLEDAYSAAAEKLARNAFRNGNAHELIPCKPSAACRARVHPELRPEGLPPSARCRGDQPLRGSVSEAAGLSGRRAAGGRGDAAIAELPVPPGRTAESQMAALRRGQPALVCALGHHAGRGAARRCRRAANWTPRGRREGRPPHAGRSQGARRRSTSSSRSGCASTAC